MAFQLSRKIEVGVGSVTKRGVFGFFAFLLTSAADAFAHPGHPHLPGASDHLPFQLPGVEIGIGFMLLFTVLVLATSFIEFGILIYQAAKAAPRVVRRVRGVLAAFVSLFLLSACSSGGGDEGGSPGGRPSAPAVRILHAAIDVEPVRLMSPDLSSTDARYMQDNVGYATFPQGPQNLVVERRNSPGAVVAAISGQIQDETYYSLLLSGEASQDRFNLRLLPEPVGRPEAGFGRVQLVHGLIGANTIVLRSGSFTLGPVEFRSSSGYADLPAGPQTLLLSTSDGRNLGSVTIDLADRGEATVLVGGSLGDGVIFRRVYN